MKLRAWKFRTPSQHAVRSGLASSASHENASGSDFTSQCRRSPAARGARKRANAATSGVGAPARLPATGVFADGFFAAGFFAVGFFAVVGFFAAEDGRLRAGIEGRLGGASEGNAGPMRGQAPSLVAPRSTSLAFPVHHARANAAADATA